MVPDLYRIHRVKNETSDTFTLELERLEEKSEGDEKPAHAQAAPSMSPRKAVPAFAAGQFNMLYVFGVGEIPISISGDSAKSKTLVHTTRAVGTVTRAMRQLKRGDVLGVRGPFGSPWPVEEAEGNDVVIVAGGIGLAPLRPALYNVLSQREKYGKVVLLYGTRSPADILFQRELETWRARFDLEVQVTVDRAAGGWRGNVGVVTTLIARAPFDPPNAVAMVCGPEVMMRFTAMELERRGVAADSIFLSLERNMKCATGICGHCQFGPAFVCKDGPVFRYRRIKDWIARREI
jgi:NAD(P)H-flavin reductase